LKIFMSLVVKKIRVNPQNPWSLFFFRRVPNDIDLFERNQPVAYHQVDFFHRHDKYLCHLCSVNPFR